MFKQCVENEILLTVAKSQGVTFDELQRKVRESANKTDSQVSILKIKGSEQLLIKDGFIEEKPPQAKNEPSTEAVLTLSGLFRVLEYVFVQKALTGDSLRETLDIIAENQAEKLPLVFKKWRYFNSHGMQEKMVARLRSYFHFFPEGYHYTPQYRFLNRLTAAGAKKVTGNDFESMRQGEGVADLEGVHELGHPAGNSESLFQVARIQCAYDLPYHPRPSLQDASIIN